MAELFSIETINQDEWDVPDQLLANGVPVYYCDKRCVKDSHIIQRLPDGRENLLEISENGERLVLQRFQ